MQKYTKNSSVEQQTNDPTKFPIESNIDSSIGLGLLNDKNMDPISRKTAPPPGQESDSGAPDIQLENTDRRKLKPKVGRYRIEYNEDTEQFQLINQNNNISKITRRSNLHLLQRFGHTFTDEEKEIVVWIRLNSYNRDISSLISEIIYLFNISENKANFLLDSSNV